MLVKPAWANVFEGKALSSIKHLASSKTFLSLKLKKKKDGVDLNILIFMGPGHYSNYIKISPNTFKYLSSICS